MNDRVSYREFSNMMDNFIWERVLKCQGEMLVDEDYEEMISLWYKKGYGRDNMSEREMRSAVLIMIDEISKDYIDKRLQAIKLDVLEIYHQFVDDWYDGDE